MRSPHIAIRSSRGSGYLFVVAMGLILFLPHPLRAAAQNKKGEKQKLEKSYKEWLERDVVYIITREEKNAFLKLTTDEARDQFVQQFWEIRNPTPGSEENTYKNEIYERITYANSHFGSGANEEAVN